MKKTILSLMIMGAGYSYAGYVSFLHQENAKYEIYSIVGEEIDEGSWKDIGNPYDCDQGFPLTESYTQGESFQQTQNCVINQEKIIKTYIVYSNGEKHLKETKTVHQTIPKIKNITAIGSDDVEGFIIALRSQHNQSALNAYDVNQTSLPTWAENFSKTKDIVINQVTMANNRISKTGVIDWFNPDKKLEVYFSKGCWSGDTAYTNIQFLNKDNAVVAWFNTRYHSTYGLQANYGTNPNLSSGSNPGVIGPHPSLTGYFSFDRDNGTLRYVNTKSDNYIKNWSINNIDIESIRKIKLSYSDIMTTYTGATCGANVLMDVTK